MLNDKSLEKFKNAFYQQNKTQKSFMHLREYLLERVLFDLQMRIPINEETRITLIQHDIFKFIADDINEVKRVICGEFEIEEDHGTLLYKCSFRIDEWHFAMIKYCLEYGYIEHKNLLILKVEFDDGMKDFINNFVET